jgi:hypothetical protein
MRDEMKIIIMLSLAFVLTLLVACSATHTVKFGKKCTPGHTEWSYVWIVERGGENVSKANCRLED